ncbi:MAG: hypothetical protein SVV67_02895 [Bacillota bacterium]|nr:hypothetical protein [Bacillota bacterium]
MSLSFIDRDEYLEYKEVGRHSERGPLSPGRESTAGGDTLEQ